MTVNRDSKKWDKKIQIKTIQNNSKKRRRKRFELRCRFVRGADISALGVSCSELSSIETGMRAIPTDMIGQIGRAHV